MTKQRLHRALSLFLALVMLLSLPLSAVAAPESGGENVDDRDRRIHYTGTWYPYDDAAHYQSSVTYTNAAGSSFELTFTGSGVELYGQATMNSGILLVSIDGGPETEVDFFSPSAVAKNQEKLYTSPALEDGEHVLRGTVSQKRNPDCGASSPQVALDFIRIPGTKALEILPDTEPRDNTMMLWYQKPASSWENEALPVGNGYMGAMVYGDVVNDRVQFNEKTLWMGGPGSVEDYTGGIVEGAGAALEPMRQALRDGDTGAVRSYANRLAGKSLATNGWGSYQNMGDLYFHMKGFEKGGQVTGYRRELDLVNGVASTSYTFEGVDYVRDYLVSYPDNVMAIHFKASEPESISFTLDPQLDTVYPRGMPDTPPSVNPDLPTKEFTQTAEGNRITIRGTVTENGMKFEVQLAVDTMDTGTVTANPDGTLTVTGATMATVFVTAGTDYANESSQWTDLHNPPDYRGEDPHAAVTARLDAALSKGYGDIYFDHMQDVYRIMERQTLDIGQGDYTVPTNELIQNYGTGNAARDRMVEYLIYQMGRYMILSSSRTGSLPANLQGVWNNSNKPAWSGDYHMNVNLQMNYWAAAAGNIPEAGKSLVDYVETLVAPGRLTAREHHNVTGGGWTVHTISNPFGMTAPGWSFYWGWSPASNAWICQNLWDYYEFTRDEEILRDQIYPVMREAALFWTKNLVDDGQGGLMSSPTYSSEHGPITAGNTYDQSLVYQLMQDTVLAAQALGLDKGEDKEFCAQIADIKDKLHPYAVGSWGQIKEWREEDDWANRGAAMGVERGHRHMSHMLGLYPGNQITRDTPDLLDAARVTLGDRGDGGTGWAKALKMLCWARVHDGDHAHAIYSQMIRNNINDNLFATHPPFQIDGNLGVSAGVPEMLLQSHTGYIQMLPALPGSWNDGSARGLAARGGFDVDMTWTMGKVTSWSVTSNKGGLCRIYAPDYNNEKIMCNDGQAVAATYENQILSFPTEAWKTYSMTVDQPPVQSLKLEPSSVTLKERKTVTLKPVFTPVNAFDQRITWHSLDEKVATVSPDGTVTAVGVGTTQISIVTYDGEFTADCTVEVIEGDREPFVIENTDPEVTSDWGVWEHLSFMPMNKDSKGQSFTVTFIGTSLQMVGQMAKNGPLMTVNLDGENVGEADFYSGDGTHDGEIWSVYGLEKGEHTVTFTFEGKANPAASPIGVNYQAAYDCFIIDGLEADGKLNTIVLKNALAEAEAAAKDVQISDLTPEQVEEGVRFVSAAAGEALQEAVQTAEDALAAAQTLRDVEKAAQALTAATEAYKAAIQVGTCNKEEADRAAARAVEDQIAALGEITLDSEEAIAAARKAYDGLTEAQKALVPNLAALEKAEWTLAWLQDELRRAKHEVDKAVIDAQLAARDILVADKPADQVDKGVKFVTPAADQALRDAIDKAEAIKASSTDAGEILAAEEELRAATEAYKAAIQVGTYEEPVLVNPFEDVKEKDWFYDPVLWAVEGGITAGVTPTRFGPDKFCTRAQAVTFLWRAAGKPAPASRENPFRDLNEKEYYMDAILWAVEKGITQGVSADRFAPERTCTRAQIVTFLWRYAGKPEPRNTDQPFTDLNENEYYMNPVLWAVENEITAGITATTFAPEHTCTRAQIVTFLYRENSLRK